MPKEDSESSLSAYKVAVFETRHQSNNTMANNPGQTYKKARSLRDFILERGCQEYEELVEIRDEVNCLSLTSASVDTDDQNTSERRPTYHTDAHWLKIGYFTLKEIDVKLRRIL